MDITKRTTFSFHAVNVALAACVAAVAFFDVRLAGQLGLLVSVTWLAMLLIVPRIMHVPALKPWHPQLLEAAKQSKWVGLWVFGWFTAYMAAVLSFSSKELPLAIMAWLVLFVLTLISNKWSYNHIKLWKHISVSVWALPCLFLGHIVLVEPPFKVVMATLLLLTILAGVSSIWQKRDYFFWHRLGWLGLSAVVALLAGLL